MNVIVCICTWNRAKLLRQTLESLTAQQTAPDVEWSVLVINNNCTDETDSVVREFQGRLPIRLLHETTPGKSNALNRGLAEANCDWMLFTDDDVQVDMGWVLAYARALEQMDDRVAFVGGAVIPWFETHPSPELVAGIPTVGNGFCGVEVVKPRTITCREDGLPVGANAAVRMRAVRNERFDPRLGPKGKQRIVSEEYQFFSGLLERGHHGAWLPGVDVKHFVPAERLQLRSLVRHIFDLGRMDVVLSGVPAGRRVFGVPMWVLRELLESIALAPLCLLAWNWSGFYKNISRMSSRAGIVWQCLSAPSAVPIKA